MPGCSATLCDHDVGQQQPLMSCHNPATLNQLAECQVWDYLSVKGERKVHVYPYYASEAP